DIARGLAEVDHGTAGIRVRGFVSPPHLTKPTRALQYLFVNGRPVRTRTLTASLDQAFRSLTPERRFPIVALMIEVDPALVDVNVSPTKSEVKFQNEGVAFDALRYAVKSALMEHGMIPSLDAIRSANEALASVEPPSSGALWAPGFASAGRSGSIGSSLTFPSSAEASIAAQAPIESPAAGGWVGEALAAAGVWTAETPASEPGAVASRSSTERFPFADLLDGLRVLGQVRNTFIVAENRKGIVIVDQHVAHERILYEHLCGIRGDSAIEIQHLLAPETLTLDKRSAVMLRERIDEIRAIGFDLEPFGGDSFVVRSVPAAVRGRGAMRLLRDLIDELVEGAVARRLSPTREQIWITTACKMAVKAGDPLSLAEMEKLIVDLASTENPYLCPHGRPITVTLSIDDLMRKFKRA
ncbi:MAG: DNA mismatch repair endonuclease MutL, partial [Fimbriimonadaceae bacterium]